MQDSFQDRSSGNRLVIKKRDLSIPGGILHMDCHVSDSIYIIRLFALKLTTFFVFFYIFLFSMLYESSMDELKPCLLVFICGSIRQIQARKFAMIFLRSLIPFRHDDMPDRINSCLSGLASLDNSTRRSLHVVDAQHNHTLVLLRFHR